MEVSISAEGKTSRRIQLELRDLNKQLMPVTLWDNYAEEIATYVKRNPEEAHVVLIVQTGHLKSNNGNKSFSNCYNASRLFINEDVEELQEFKKSYVDKFFSESSTSQLPLSSMMISTLEDKFLNKVMFTTIKGIKNVKQAKSLVIVGTISGIPLRIQWYYEGCVFCKRKAEETIVTVSSNDGSSEVEFEKIWECPNQRCPQQQVSVTKRFKIPINVIDCSNNSVALTLFDYQAEKLLGKSAKEVYENYPVIGSSDETLPEEFKLLIGKKFAFIIEKGDFNLKHTDSEFFGISKVTDDPSIIQKLEIKSNDYQDDVEDSTNSNVFFEGSQTTFEDKDSTSYINEEQTPISTLLRHTISDGHGLKRNLGDAFDVDDYDAGSSSKTQRVDLVEDSPLLERHF